MKKKILAVLLTLCMVLGLLPLSAMAETWSVKLDAETTVKLKKDGESYKVTGSDADRYKYYSFAKDSDGKFYYTYMEPQHKDYGKTYSNFVSSTLEDYDVNFDPNGGTGAVTKVTVSKDAKVAEADIPAFTRTSYTLKGWGTEPNTAVASAISNATVAATAYNADTTLYAVWEEVKAPTYTITFVAGEGASVTPTSAETEEDGTLASLPTPTREGYNFAGWYKELDTDGITGKGDKVTTATVFTGDTTIYAAWSTEPVYTVKLDPNGGKIGDSTTVVNSTTDTDGVINLPTPTRDHYKFLGWFTAKTGGKEVASPATIKNNTTTLYAQWGAIVTLDANGGTLTGESTVVTKADGKLASLPAEPTREGGYIFLGWFTKSEDGSKVTTSTVLAGGATIYAQWEGAILVEATVEVGDDGKADATVEIEGTETEEAQKEWVDEKKADPNPTILVTATSNKDVKSVSVTIPKTIMGMFGKVDKPVQIETNRGRFLLSKTDVDALAGVGSVEDIVLEIAEEENAEDEGISAPSKSKVSRVVDVSLTDGKNPIAPKGTKLKLGIMVSVKTELTIDSGYKAAVWYYDRSSEKFEAQTSVSYESGLITWKATHFSEYVFGETETGGGNGTGGGGGGGGSASSGYSVSVSKTTNGKVSVSPSKAEEGDTVTITVTPDKGYELDKLTVKDADGNTIKTTKKDDGKYTFTMPDGKVTIEATFKAIEEEDTAPAPATPSFSDVPSSFWAYQQIRWVAEQGIMGGYANGTFGADNNTTRQALWMVLGRLSGELDTNSTMAEAREWAIANNVSDGTNPGNAMSRQQMVTMLYRYAQMKGYATNGSTNLSTYPDAAGVASYAQDALSWAVANGVVTGTTDGRLNPEGTASRAHFAVFMYRFCGLYADEA